MPKIDVSAIPVRVGTGSPIHSMTHVPSALADDSVMQAGFKTSGSIS